MRTLYGLDVLKENDFDILRGRRIGLITNYSGISSELKPNIELMLSAGINVIKIFTPEHGFFGASDGLEIKDTVHPKYGIRMVSLYGDKKIPAEEDLEDIDILVYDIQDVGLRFYTFIYTLAYTLESASKYGVSYVVLDRPNPLSGDVIIGPRILDQLNSFVGGYRLPIRYGLTAGELALYYSKLKGLALDLTVIRMKNWTRDMYYPDTGLLWNVPSPNLPTFSGTLCYAGMCFIEATNISEGRGTTKPFEYIGAPWIDEDIVFEELKKENFPDVAFRKRYFIPEFSKYKGEVCRGLEFFPLSYKADFIKVALSLISIVARRFPEYFAYRTYNEVLSINLLIGDRETEKDLLEGKSWKSIYERWKKDEEEFRSFIEDVMLY